MYHIRATPAKVEEGEEKEEERNWVSKLGDKGRVFGIKSGVHGYMDMEIESSTAKSVGPLMGNYIHSIACLS
jgi:hypothetical protein